MNEQLHFYHVEGFAMADVNPSEDPMKVEKAILSIFYPEADVTIKKEASRILVSFKGIKALKKMQEQARVRRVRATLRRLLYLGLRENSSTIMLNRQALTNGVIALCEDRRESPLGPVYLKITVDNFNAFVDWIAPVIR
ncbi:MAG: hypothetical protein QXR69_02880 [Conexivisphaerales archaeon]